MPPSPSSSPFRALLIGGTGFLGSHIHFALLTHFPNISIHILDLHPPLNPPPNTTYTCGSITSPKTVTHILRAFNPQIVFHCASPPPLTSTKKTLDEVNINGTRNLLQCLKDVPSENGRPRVLVYTSSTGILHTNISPIHAADETSPIILLPEQKFHYHHTKAVAETLILSANSPPTLLTAAIRPGSLFGEGDRLLTPNLIETGRKNIIIGTGQNGFDFTYVGNAAYAHVLAASKLLHHSRSQEKVADDERVDGQAFMLVEEPVVGFWDFAAIMAGAAGYAVDRTKTFYISAGLLLFVLGIWEWVVWIVTFGVLKPSVTRDMVRPTTLERTFVIDKIKGRLGYRAPVGMEEAVRRTVGWWKSEYQGEGKKKV